MIKFVKKANQFCKKSSESCEAWGARMTAPAGVPVLDANGLPTGATGAGMCAAAGIAHSPCQIGILDITMNAAACELVACPAS